MPISPTKVRVEVYGVVNNTKVDARIDLPDGTTLWSTSRTLMRGERVQYEVSVPDDTEYVVLVVTVNDIELPPGAVLMPKMLLSPTVDEPLLTLLAMLIPVAPALSFMLTGDLRAGALAALLTTPFAYVIASALAPAPAQVPIALSSVLVAAIALYLVGRRAYTE
ncbi:MAG: hypothetical protein QW067_11660 [Thermofilaceae archaeon]